VAWRASPIACVVTDHVDRTGPSVQRIDPPDCARRSGTGPAGTPAPYRSTLVFSAVACRYCTRHADHTFT
jgi:hypothetical protein